MMRKIKREYRGENFVSGRGGLMGKGLVVIVRK